MIRSSVKKFLIKKCPRFLWHPAAKLLRKEDEIRRRLIMTFFPKRMRVSCPCCGMKFRAFIARDYKERPEVFNPSRYANTRQDVICPVCRALPRHRILALWCGEHLSMLKSSKILYFAPEHSMMLWLKRNNIRCETADLYGEADYKLDIQNTGLPNEMYDVIICNHVLEHVDNFRAALREMYRVLRSKGIFICSFPMDPKIEFLDEDMTIVTNEERLRRFGQIDHKRVFGMKSERILEDAGFAVEKISGETYPEEILPVVGPADYDMNCLFCCKKT